MRIHEAGRDSTAVEPNQMSLGSDQRLEVRVAAALHNPAAADRDRVALRMAKNPALVKHQIGFCATHLPLKRMEGAVCPGGTGKSSQNAAAPAGRTHRRPAQAC